LSKNSEPLLICEVFQIVAQMRSEGISAAIRVFQLKPEAQEHGEHASFTLARDFLQPNQIFRRFDHVNVPPIQKPD
jgi:hypothetical protein